MKRLLLLGFISFLCLGYSVRGGGGGDYEDPLLPSGITANDLILGDGAGTAMYADIPECNTNNFLNYTGMTFGCANPNTTTTSIANKTIAQSTNLLDLSGGVTITGLTDDDIMIGDGAGTSIYTNVPECNTGSMLTYTESTHAFGCETDDGGAPTTADISDVNVIQDELEELETIGSTIIEAADWTALAALVGVNTGDSHTILSHSDTTGTGAELDTLTGAGDADALHTHTLKANLANPVFTSSLRLPKDGTLDSDGEITIDLTDGQLQYRASTGHVLIPQRTKCFTLEDPVAADDDIPLWLEHPAITVISMRCIVEGGTNVIGFLSDGTNALDSMTCTTSAVDDDGSIANATFTAGERMEWDTTSASGTPSWLNFCWTYTVDAT